MPGLRSIFKRKGSGGLRSHIDTLTTKRIAGWAMDPKRENLRIGLELHAGNRIVAAGRADQFRADLLAASMGDGCHGFDFEISPALSQSELASLRIRAVEAKIDLNRPYGVASEGISLSPLFDARYYASQLKNITRKPLQENLLLHYRREGWKLGLNPHPLFDTDYYLRQVDGTISDDPLTHFFKEGQKQFLSPHPLCDIAYCTQNRPDIAKTGQHPLIHYVQYGHKEDISLSPLFDLDFYREQFEEDKFEGGIFEHYLSFGWKEGLKPHREFDPLIFQRLMAIKDDVEPYSHLLKSLAYSGIESRKSSGSIKFSFIILNLNKSIITLQCLAFLKAFTETADYEVIVVDNGSNWQDFAVLCKYAPFARIIRSESNLGFGEGNNLGVDQASGEFLIFLNNDAFVTKGWLPPLLAAIEGDPGIGAAGPKFLYADGRLQEAGGWMGADGTPIQRGKYLDPSDPLFNEQCFCDYCSAATLIMRTSSFRKVLGYDLCFDPAYYEDVDLCLKLRLIGERTVYVPTSEVIHLEHATAGDRSLSLHMDGIPQVNRVKFVARWGRLLAGQSDGTVERRLIPKQPCAPPISVRAQRDTQDKLLGKRLGLFSPYPLTPGGGERYLLSLAAALREDYDCTLLTNTRYSRERLLTLARELDLPLDHVTITRWGHNVQHEIFDVFVCMSNEILPAVPAIGRVNLFICQFPFPMASGIYAQRWENLEGYDAVIAYSKFVVEHTAAAAAKLGLRLPPTRILAPPVPRTTDGRARSTQPIRIVNVGRFTPAGHCKRQDVMIEVFRNLCQAVDVPLELHLAGALGSAAIDREYLVALQQAGRGLPVKFHLNTTPEHIDDLYGQASIYWHMTGAHDDVRRRPECFEHFGITIGEAMSAGAIPISLRYGGPGEIITDGQNGYLVSNAQELYARTMAVIAKSEPELTKIRDAARTRAAEFAIDQFEHNLRNIIKSMR